MIRELTTEEQQIFSELYKKYRPVVFRTACSSVFKYGSKFVVDADDITQITFLSLMSTDNFISKYKSGYFKTEEILINYLAQCAINKLLSVNKKLIYRTSYCSLDDETLGVERNLEFQTPSSCNWELFSSMYRNTVPTLHKITEGYTAKDISEKDNVKLKTVYWRLNRDKKLVEEKIKFYEIFNRVDVS